MNGRLTRFLSGAERSVCKARSELWQKTVERLRLDWTGLFESVHESWNIFRNPLAHGFREEPEHSSETMFNAYSRISGAIYILLARDIGYSGAMAASILENKTTLLEPMPELPSVVPLNREL